MKHVIQQTNLLYKMNIIQHAAYRRLFKKTLLKEQYDTECEREEHIDKAGGKRV